MTKLTPQLKEKLYALYWGQEVKCYTQLDGPFMIDDGRKMRTSVSYLLLRPITQVTDEEAIEVAKIWRPLRGNVGYNSQFHTAICGREIIDRLNGYDRDFETFMLLTDYLRSKGFALPFMGISVEEFIEAGWIKLLEG